LNKYEKLQKLIDSDFKLITGVTRELFEKMLEILRHKYKITHAKGGRKGVPVELKLTIALEYWREYRGMRHMALDYDIPKSTLCDCITWVEDVLNESEEFKLKELKEQFKPGQSDIKIVLIDVTEQPIERPTYGQKDSYSGKKNSYN
jgi:hypothetical protein